ncbi:ESPR domain-containing protein, partial [Acinetobacter nectaris]|uniref:ESPR domain-containing protein n=1 Tax=Acinetobacter nectaris TaxID=1219382 RepID=UPI00235139DF
MNQVYKIIWNVSLGVWVAVSEAAKAKTKSKTVGAVSLLTSIVVFLPGAFAQVGTTGGTGGGTAISSCTGNNQANSGTDPSNIVIGCSATSGTATRSVAIGDNATTSGANSQSVAVGSVAAARGDQSVAVGNNVNANGNSSIAIGGDDIDRVRNDATASKSYQTITGSNLPTGYPETTATGGGAVVVGVTAQAKGSFSSAFGMAANAIGDASVALGTTSVANGQGALAIGAVSAARDNGSIALGINTNAKGLNSTAIGSGSSSLTGSQTTGDYATAIGSGSNAVAGATAIGSGAKAQTIGGVAIGSNSISSIDSGVSGYYSVTGQNSSDTTGVWKSTNAAVSIGNGSTLTRQITGLAAGQQDTDAVNVAQLKSTRTIATNNLKTAIGTSASTDTNGNLTISNIAGTGKSNLNDAIATVKQSADDQFAKLKTEGNQITQGNNSNT